MVIAAIWSGRQRTLIVWGTLLRGNVVVESFDAVVIDGKEVAGVEFDGRA